MKTGNVRLRTPGCVLALLGVLLASPTAARADARPTFANPILPGFHPDPSVCRVGDDYYLVNSSFEYFPGIPIFHSRDLVNWRPIGHVLDRPSQLNLDGIAPSAGIWAATIRQHKGTYYVTVTLVNYKAKARFVNLMVTAKNPAGPWSDPVVLTESFFGIDPSLYFEDDGRVYFAANRTGLSIITLQELDLKTRKLFGPTHDIGEGHGRTALAPEGPHIYKKDGYYYLLIAEGGTFDGHAVTISRAKVLTGPYELFQNNPILTHRHFGPGLDIHAVGHADLVDTPRGEWWMVVLGTRGVGGHCCSLGRETFLVPVVWPKDEWPIVNPGVGRVRMIEPRPDLPVFEVKPSPARDLFDGKRLAFLWNFIRTPRGNFWSLTARPGFLRLSLKPEILSDDVNPAFIGRRLQHADFSARAKIEFAPRGEDEAAGIAIRNGKNYFAVIKTRTPAGEVVRAISHGEDADHVLAEAVAPPGPIHFRIEGRGESDYRFFFAREPETWIALGDRADGVILGQKAPGGHFTGAYVGVYATSRGKATRTFADYDYFEYRPEPGSAP